MMLVIDNYDSFTYNLVQCFGALGVVQKVVRNNDLSATEALALNPDRVVISPGPCTPDEAGNSLDLVGAFAGKKPVLGVCLGHQCIGQYFGGHVVRADRLMHGKTSTIRHNGGPLFEGMEAEFTATRYHSLILERPTLPDCFEITAETAENEIMGIKHRELPLWGVQFHPESYATKCGMEILKNFLRL